MRRSILIAALLFAASACHSSLGAYSAGTAAATTVLATAVAGARRASGDCYTACPPGTSCNQRTGMCDSLPCRGECTENQVCDESGILPKCVARTSTALEVVRAAPKPEPKSESSPKPETAPKAEPATAKPSDLPRAEPTLVLPADR